MTSTLARLKATAVFISGPDGTGTGYLVSSDRIATANHVVKSWTDSTDYPVIVGVNGVKRQARVLKRDSTTDAALLGIDEPVDVVPFPIGTGLVRNVAWDGFGFPQSGEKSDNPAGLPLDGLVKDPATRNNVDQPAVLLFSDMAAAGNASPLNGFSGSAVVVADTLVGHLTKHIGDVDDQRRPRYGYVFACPIEAVVALFDFTPDRATIRAPIAHSIGDGGTMEQYRSAYVGLTLEALKVQINSERASQLAQFFQSLNRSLQTLIRQGEKTTVLNVDSCIGGHRTRAAEARLHSVDLAGRQRRGSIESDLIRQKGKASTLETQIKKAEALQPPCEPTLQQLPPFSGGSDAERLRQGEWMQADYQRRLGEYKKAKLEYQLAKDQLPADRQQLSQIEQQVSQRRIELISFNQSFEANLSHLGREVDIARGQDIAKHLAELIDAARHDLHDGTLVPRGFAQLLMCNASAIVLRPWIDDSFPVFQALVNDIGGLLTQTVLEFPIDLALDCLTRCQLVLDSLERNKATLQEIGSMLEQSSRKDLEVALSEIRKLRALPLPPSTPPKAGLIAPDYDKLLKTIGQATKQLQSIREQLQFHEGQYAGLLKEATLRLEGADQFRLKMVDEESRVKGIIDDLSFIWVDLCSHERITVLPRNVVDFIATVQREVSRRHSLTLGSIVEQCRRTRFLLEDAETRIGNDLCAVLRRENEELSSHFGALDGLSAAYSAAMEEASKSAKSIVGRFWQVLRK